jgi:hypothetical protein
MDSTKAVRRLDRDMVETTEAFVNAYLSCEESVEATVETLYSIAQDEVGCQLLAIRRVALDSDDPVAAITEDENYARDLMESVMDKEPVLIAFLATLPEYHVLKFCEVNNQCAPWRELFSLPP